MANLKLNEILVGTDSDLVLFDSVSNILSITNDIYTDDIASLDISVASLATIVSGTEYYISINGSKIYSTDDYSKAVGNYFFLNTNNTQADRLRVTNSIVKALRNNGSISSNYKTNQVVNEGIFTTEITMTARQRGSVGNITVETNIPSSSISFSNTDAEDEGLTGSAVSLDIYADDDYETTLSKKFADNEVRFNISPTLTALSKTEEAVKIGIQAYSHSADGILNFQQGTSAHLLKGYAVLESDRYLDISDKDVVLLQYVEKGDLSTLWLNHTTLFTATENIPITIFCKPDYFGSKTVSIRYKSGDTRTLYTQTQTFSVNSQVTTLQVQANNDTYFQQADNLEIEIPDLGFLRYDIIKPLNAHETNHRVYFHNSYGGLSFFDFVGAFTEQRNIEGDYYQKSSLYYYDGEDSSDISYDRKIDKECTLESHLLNEHSIYTLYDMQLSGDAWINIDGIKHKVFGNQIEVEKIDDNAYKATVTFTYSAKETNSI